jgi:hypothetical protein
MISGALEYAKCKVKVTEIKKNKLNILCDTEEKILNDMHPNVKLRIESIKIDKLKLFNNHRLIKIIK